MSLAVTAPLNGPISLNGFHGDAVFRTGQGFSTIARHLTKGLEMITVSVDGHGYLAVEAMITLGNNYQVKFPLLIYEEATDLLGQSGLLYVCTSEEEKAWFPYEVILGMDFLHELNVNIDYGRRVMTGTFGAVPIPGQMRRFVLKDYTITDYMGDTDDDRVILLFDMDCFEVQVHEQPWQRGKPRVVVNSSERIVAVSYEAKRLGISRTNTPYLSAAKKLCPEVIAIEIPTRPCKAGGRPRPDTSIAREATANIVEAIKTKLASYDNTLTIFQFSSGDEFYVDVTQLVNQVQYECRDPMEMINYDELWTNTFLYTGAVVGTPTAEYIDRRLETLARKRAFTKLEIQEIRLIFGSTIASSIVREILNTTGYQSSVGMGSKKLISKIASGLHKPGSITILTPSSFDKFSAIVKIEDIPGLGGKIGQAIKNQFNVSTMSELQRIDENELANCPIPVSRGCSPSYIGDKKAKEILNSAHGVCDEPVVPAICFKTSGVCRQLYGVKFTAEDMKEILHELVKEFLEKLVYEERVNSRIPAKIKATIELKNATNISSTVEVNPEADIGDANELCHKLFPTRFSNWNSDSVVQKLELMASF